MYDRNRRSPGHSKTEAQVVDEDHWVLIVSPKVHLSAHPDQDFCTLVHPRSEVKGTKTSIAPLGPGQKPLLAAATL